jgi:competence protein ComEC
MVSFLDVGQGDAVFIKGPAGRTCLIDGGGKPGGALTDVVGEQVVVPFLQNMGLGRLDLVILSHPHDDHMLGLVTVLNTLQVDRLVVAERFISSPALNPLFSASVKKQIPLSTVAAGQEIVLEQGVKLSVLHPPRGKLPEEEDVNDNSLVLKLTYRDISFLLTGDGEATCLSTLAGREDLSSEVLKLPHHGSKTGLVPRFYREVAPRAVVISVGKNSFGHPAPEVLEFWEEQGIPVFRTDLHGAITFSTDGRELWVETFY